MAYYIEFSNQGHLIQERISTTGPVEAILSLKAKYPRSRVVHVTTEISHSTHHRRGIN